MYNNMYTYTIQIHQTPILDKDEKGSIYNNQYFL